MDKIKDYNKRNTGNFIIIDEDKDIEHAFPNWSFINVKKFKQYLFNTCVKNHWYVKRMETDQDPVHILLQYNPTDSITRIVSILKQHSTYLSWQQHSALLEQHYWKKHVLWSDSYFAASIGTVSQAVIERYIENQG